MRITISAPGLVHRNSASLAPVAPYVTLDGGLLTFDSADELPLGLIRKLDEDLGLAIADADDAELILAMSHLKSSILEFERRAHIESSYTMREPSDLAAHNEEATESLDISHSHAKQHASTEVSPEQHGVAPENEETKNEQADETQQGQYPGFYGLRA